jgi:hypothetical protein
MKMREAYIRAKTAKIDAYVTCPACGKKFIKKFYNQIFCSNAKTKLSNNCKDKFWNTVDPRKRNNTTRISPANRSYYNLYIRERIERAEMVDDDQGWDAHKNSF